MLVAVVIGVTVPGPALLRLSDVGGLAVRRDRDLLGLVSDRDRRSGGVGGGRDRGHRVRTVVGDVGGLAVRRDRDRPGPPTVIGGPAVLVAVVIGVTVPEAPLTT